MRTPCQSRWYNNSSTNSTTAFIVCHRLRIRNLSSTFCLTFEKLVIWWMYSKHSNNIIKKTPLWKIPMTKTTFYLYYSGGSAVSSAWCIFIICLDETIDNLFEIVYLTIEQSTLLLFSLLHVFSSGCMWLDVYSGMVVVIVGSVLTVPLLQQ